MATQFVPDGGVFGPLPPTGWTMQLNITGSNQIDAIALLSQNTDTSLSEHKIHRLKTEENHLSFLDSLIAVSPEPCDSYCSHLGTCGRCSRDANCAWCTNTTNNSMVTGACVPIEQVNESMICNTGREECDGCASYKTCEQCTNDRSRIGCGWCSNTNTCTSGYAHFPFHCPFFHGQQMKIKVFILAAFRYMHHNAPLVDHWISVVIDVASAGAMDRLAVQPGRATLYTSCPSVQLDTLLKTLPKIR